MRQIRAINIQIYDAREKLEPVTKSVWGNLSPSHEFPDHVDSYWNERIFMSEIHSTVRTANQTFKAMLSLVKYQIYS